MLEIGDIAERALRLFGITKERVQDLTGRKDCGCAKRQAAMNEWGRSWQNGLFFLLHQSPFAWLRLRYRVLVVRVQIAKRYFRMAFRALFYGR